jgi:hypothetical protein
MPDILPTEIVTLLIGVVSIGAADLVYHNGTINPRLHSLWVSVSITVMCLPILDWAAIVFVGTGGLSHVLIGIFEVVIFFGSTAICATCRRSASSGTVFRHLRRPIRHRAAPVRVVRSRSGPGDPLSGNQNHAGERAAGGADRTDSGRQAAA